jgi:hypothetical protein
MLQPRHRLVTPQRNRCPRDELNVKLRATLWPSGWHFVRTRMNGTLRLRVMSSKTSLSEGETVSFKSTSRSNFEPAAARSAVDELLAAGTSPRDVKLVIRTATRDVRNQSAGTFAGAIGPDAPVGTFAGKTRLRSQAAGGWAGNPDSQRQGSFADAQCEKVVTFDDGREVSRTISSPGLARLLQPVAHDREHGEKLLAEPHQGHAIVLVAHPTEVAQISAHEMVQTDTEQEGEREAA